GDDAGSASNRLAVRGSDGARVSLPLVPFATGAFGACSTSALRCGFTGSTGSGSTIAASSTGSGCGTTVSSTTTASSTGPASTTVVWTMAGWAGASGSAWTSRCPGEAWIAAAAGDGAGAVSTVLVEGCWASDTVASGEAASGFSATGF